MSGMDRQTAGTPGVEAPGVAVPGLAARWMLATRPKTLPAAAAPVLVGTAAAFAADGFRLLPALAALVGALLLQIAANLANDVQDHERGADTGERLGPTRVVQSGLLPAAAVRRATALVLLLALLIGVYLTAVAGWPVVVMGLTSMAAAIAYTGGPFPLGYHGLGDIAVMIFFGFVAVCGTTYVQALHVPPIAWWASLPPGALSVGILVVNNHRDRASDAAAGKHTMAVRLGRRGTIGEYLIMLFIAYAVPAGLVATGRVGLWGLLPFLTLPLAAGRLREVRSWHGRELNQTLAGTAKLLFAHGALFALGIALGTGLAA